MTNETGCLACEGKNPMNWILTRLNPAATIYVCEQDISQALTALLATELGVEAGWLTAQINAAIDAAEAADQAAEAGQEQPDPAEQRLEQADFEAYQVYADE